MTSSAPPRAAGVLLSAMRSSDLDEVVAIAERAFDPPWTRRGIEDELGRAVSRCRVARIAQEGPVLAYAIWWIVATEQHLLAIAARPDARRRGLARALLEELLAEGEARGVTECFLEVRPSNAAAIALYRAYGFEHLDTRPCYYDDGEDAWIMVRRRAAP